MIYYKIGIPDEQAERIGAALLAAYKYQPTVYNPESMKYEANPEDPVTFQLRIFERMIKEVVKSQELPDLAKTDREAAAAAIDAFGISIELIIE